MLSSFQNSNFFKCPCKVNERQLLECSAKKTEIQPFKTFKGKDTPQNYPEDVFYKKRGSVIKFFS
jgi:hypothetical protein